MDVEAHGPIAQAHEAADSSSPALWRSRESLGYSM